MTLQVGLVIDWKWEELTEIHPELGLTTHQVVKWEELKEMHHQEVGHMMHQKWVGPPMTHQEEEDLIFHQQGRDQLIHQGVGPRRHHQEFEHQEMGPIGQKKMELVIHQGVEL